MTIELLTQSPEPSAAVRREAAVWIARIHSPDRTPLVDAGLRRWLKESPQHAKAFELANELWDTAGRLPDGAIPRMMRWKRVTPSTSFPLPRAAVAFGVLAALIVGVGAFYYLQDPALTTGIGEQRTVNLQDGTRVSLNTATRIFVRYDAKVRHIRLESGEALFEVARRPQWPFVVTAGDREITALGTAFIVRRDEQKTAVTLVEGKVIVSPLFALEESEVSAKQEGEALSPGERLTFAAATPPRLDRPKLDKLTAWQRGLVALDYTRLTEAAAEMNRYSVVKLTIDSPEAAEARISGVFRAGDSLLFAQAIARTYQLAVLEEPGRIVISGIPRAGIPQAEILQANPR